MGNQKTAGRKQAEDLIWYFKNLNDDGRETLLKIARSFVSTGVYARTEELSEELREHLKKYGALADEMRDYEREIPD